MITLEEITPEYIQQLHDEAEEGRLASIVRDKVLEISQQWKIAKQNAELLEVECKLRAIRLYECNISAQEIADMFGVRITTVKRWLKP